MLINSPGFIKFNHSNFTKVWRFLAYVKLIVSNFIEYWLCASGRGISGAGIPTRRGGDGISGVAVPAWRRFPSSVPFPFLWILQQGARKGAQKGRGGRGDLYRGKQEKTRENRALRRYSVLLASSAGEGASSSIKASIAARMIFDGVVPRARHFARILSA